MQKALSPVDGPVLAGEAVIGGDEVAGVELDPRLVSEALQPPAWVIRQLRV